MWCRGCSDPRIEVTFMKQRASRTAQTCVHVEGQGRTWTRVRRRRYNRTRQRRASHSSRLASASKGPPTAGDHPDGAIEYAPPALYKPKLPLPRPLTDIGARLGKKYEKFLECRLSVNLASSSAWSRSCSSTSRRRRAKGGGGPKSDHRVRGVPSGPPALAGRNAGSGRPSQHRSRPAPAPA